MLRRVVCIIVCVTMCTTILSLMVYANPEKVTYTDNQKKLIYIKFIEREQEVDTLFCEPASLGYWNMVEGIEKDRVMSNYITLSSWIVDELPREEDYAEILANLIMMQEGDLSEALEMQKNFDTPKQVEDYINDVLQITESFVGGSGVLSDFESAISGFVGGGEVVIENMGQAKYYQITTQCYARVNGFLKAVSEYAEEEKLRKVSDLLLQANDMLYQRRLEHLNEIAESVSSYSADVFMKEFSWDIIENSELYKENDVIKKYIDCGKGLLSSVSQTLSMGEFAFHMTMLAGNIGFGTSSVYNRYQEMKALVDIAKAVIEADSNIMVLPNYLSERTIDKIRVKCDYYKMLIVIHARGDFLNYQLLVKDSKLLSYFLNIFDLFKEPSQTVQGWYESQIDVLTRKYDEINNIFTVQGENEQNVEDIVVEGSDIVEEVQEGTYSYKVGEKTSLLEIEKSNEETMCYFYFWDNDGSGNLLEGFSFNWQAGQEEYNTVGENWGKDTRILFQPEQNNEIKVRIEMANDNGSWDGSGYWINGKYSKEE